MKKYNFLFRPVFFIFSLLFSTWLVLQIEKVSPSDFGKYKGLFEKSSKPSSITKKQKLYRTINKDDLMKLCSDYKAGIIDSIELDNKLKFLLESVEKISNK